MTSKMKNHVGIEITKTEARQFLLSHLRLSGPTFQPGHAGVRDCLNTLRMIQLDPLAPLGSNADLVVLARVPKANVGDVYTALLPGYAFEHYAKERCLLPTYAFPWYRAWVQKNPILRVSARLRKLPANAVDEVLEEVRAFGAAGSKDLGERGAVVPFDYSGWAGTRKATSMALEVLYGRCDLVVAGRSGRGKVYDLPERSLIDYPGGVHPEGHGPAFERWALVERVEAMGLMSVNTGPHWRVLRDAKRRGLVDEMIEAGLITVVQIEGSRRRFLAPGDFVSRPRFKVRDAMMLLGPLDPLLWDRKLLKEIFDFEYVWEVYKPKDKRRWGWYVCPLLYQGAFVGRLEGKVEGGNLKIETIWQEKPGSIPVAPLDTLLSAHAAAMGAEGFSRPQPEKWR